MVFYLGIDFGTSGARAVVINSEGNIETEANYKFQNSQSLAATWQKALFSLFGQIPQSVRGEIDAIALNGTSSTVLLCDDKGNPLDEPILYNDGRAITVLETLQEIAPPNSVVLSATSSLAKLLWWSSQPIYEQASYFLHQADWLAFLLHGKLGISDYHNALKLGFDVEKFVYPQWLQNLPIQPILPRVLPPGIPLREISTDIANRFQLSPQCLVRTGTTDSIAAFLASGATKPGEAVTSLGSTLVLKLLSRTRVENAEYGIYSHRFGNLWLTGGASNTGGAVLRHFFNDEELMSLSAEIDSTQESPLDYYPLLENGERFPIHDPNLCPRLSPRLENQVEFLHGLLESMARIEAQGYQLLQDLGATELSQVYTAGGGAKNETWRQIRERRLQVPVISSSHTEAAYGTAKLAMQGIQPQMDTDKRG